MPAQSWVTLIVGVLAVLGVALTVRQRTVADNDDEAEFGWDVYVPVTDSPLITGTEREVLRAVANRAAVRALAVPPISEDTSDAARAGGSSMTTIEGRISPVPRPRVAAAAARASIALHERDGVEVPQWLRDVAAGRPATPPPDMV